MEADGALAEVGDAQLNVEGNNRRKHSVRRWRCPMGLCDSDKLRILHRHRLRLLDPHRSWERRLGSGRDSQEFATDEGKRAEEQPAHETPPVLTLDSSLGSGPGSSTHRAAVAPTGARRPETLISEEDRWTFGSAKDTK